MSHLQDWIETVRQGWLPRLHKALQRLDPRLYATAGTHSPQRVGTVEHNVETVEYFLAHDYGFDRNWTAALKYRGSQESDGSWVYRDSTWADYQVHLTLYTSKETYRHTDVYAHLEYSPVRHPVKHYWAKHFSADGGVRAARTLLPWFEDEADLSDGLDAYAVEVF